jgi:hypothetical protein
MSSRSTGVEETKGATLRATVLAGVVIARRLSLVRSPVILEEGLRINLLMLRLLVIIL